jgi:hypothetical protein
MNEGHARRERKLFLSGGQRCSCEGPASLLSRWLHRISIAQVVMDECDTDHVDPTCRRSGETYHLVHQSDDSYVKIELGQHVRYCTHGRQRVEI